MEARRFVALHITFRVLPKSGYYYHIFSYFGNTLFYEVGGPQIQRTLRKAAPQQIS